MYVQNTVPLLNLINSHERIKGLGKISAHIS